MLEQLRSEMRVMQNAAREAREAATHEESIAEDKYDTRGLEASYLAGGQAKRASELQQLIKAYELLPLVAFAPNQKIAMTALVELEHQQKNNFFFLVPKGGGMLVKVEDLSHSLTVQIISPQSLLGAEIVGRHAGDQYEIEVAQQMRTYKVLSVK